MCAPSFLTGYTQADVDAHRVAWVRTPFWEQVFAGHATLLVALERAVAAHSGVSRSFVMGHAYGYPDELFLLSMVWGFGTEEVHDPRHVRMLTPPLQSEAIAGIVRTIQQEGAGAGWNALSSSSHVEGLGGVFGTKLLYFAGYGTTCPGPRPLVLDGDVSRALRHYDPDGAWPESIGHWRQKDYERYLGRAGQWAACEAWRGTAEIVEYALADLGKKLAAEAHGAHHAGAAAAAPAAPEAVPPADAPGGGEPAAAPVAVEPPATVPAADERAPAPSAPAESPGTSTAAAPAPAPAPPTRAPDAPPTSAPGPAGGGGVTAAG